MASLNIRNFPPDLLKALKLKAIRRDTTLRTFVIGELAVAAVSDEFQPGDAALNAKPFYAPASEGKNPTIHGGGSSEAKISVKERK